MSTRSSLPSPRLSPSSSPRPSLPAAGRVYSTLELWRVGVELARSVGVYFDEATLGHVYDALGDRLPRGLSMSDHLALWRVAYLVGGCLDGREVEGPRVLSPRVLSLCEVTTGAVRWGVSLRFCGRALLGPAVAGVFDVEGPSASVGLCAGVSVPVEGGRSAVPPSERARCMVGLEGGALVAVDRGPYVIGGRPAREVLGDQLREGLRRGLRGYSREPWPLLVGREVVVLK